jgi:ABC-type transport system involved in cytochrome c biogenesis permease subunit
MIKRIFLLLILSANISPGNDLAMAKFQNLPMQYEGRIKPLDSAARTYLTILSSKDHLKNLTAINWFAEFLFDQKTAYARPCFKIHNPDLLILLGLDQRRNHLYSFIDLAKPLQAQAQLIADLTSQDMKDLAIVQKHLLELYIKHIWFYKSSHSLALILPNFIITNQDLLETLALNQQSSYIDLLKQTDIITELILEIVTKESLNPADQELLFLVKQMKTLSEEASDTSIKIIPKNQNEWFAGWEYLKLNSNSLPDNNYLTSWQNLAMAYQNADIDLWNNNLNMLHSKLSETISSKTEIKLTLEVLYNKFALFSKATFCYLLTLILIFIGGLIHRKQNLFYQKSAFALFITGAILHITAIISRIIITSRPPVATLYESIIFVACISVLLAILLQLKKRNIHLTTISSLIAIVLLFIASKYNINQDSFGVLEAVLDNNFWLGTHVLTISIGYACCLIAGCLAHIYLILANLKNSKQKSLDELLKNISIITLIALFFSVTGTILGGIWADQSWGRFWGWDPKENGALLICLWLIFILHSKVAKMFSNFTYALGLAFTNIIVVLAWYGVNLLNVGLHSYGFTENIASNLAIFCASEILFLAIMFYLQYKQSIKLHLDL